MAGRKLGCREGYVSHSHTPNNVSVPSVSAACLYHVCLPGAWLCSSAHTLTHPHTPSHSRPHTHLLVVNHPITAVVSLPDHFLCLLLSQWVPHVPHHVHELHEENN